MEKSASFDYFPRRRLDTGRPILTSVVLCVGVWLIWQFVLPAHRLHFGVYVEENKPLGWFDIKPSSTLQFEPCFDGFGCARLDVPLDWKASTSEQMNRRAAIALVRLPAKVPVTDPRYGGAILINPGGPGGSGIEALLTYGNAIQMLADAAASPSASTSGDDKYFDVVGFDPRGINNTVPHGACFPDDASREIWEIQKEAQGVISNQTYTYVWARNHGMSESCAKRMDSEEYDHVGRYTNTPVVVEDMVAIIEALGQWRENEAQRRVRQFRVQDRTAILDRTRWRKGKEKIIYWGFSYGTVLGASFASMHPDRLHRFVVDGVVDSPDYYGGGWSTNLLDTDKIIANFFTECYASGPEKCALASYPDAEQILASVLSDLQETPLAVAAAGKYGPDLITYSNLMLYIRQSLYMPRHTFPTLARLVKSIHMGNGTEAAGIKQEAERGVGCRSESCSRDPWSTLCHDPSKNVPEQGRSVLCADAPGWLSNTTAEFHWDKFKMLKEQSRYLAPAWAEITMACAGWGIRPSWEYKPPLQGHTSHPILWLANTRDPVTPLRNAVKMSKRFPGSRVLTLDADGHCTLAAPSLCVAKNVRQYFQTGELPSEGQVCQPESGAFDGWRGGWMATKSTSAMSEDDHRLLQSVQSMHDASANRFRGPLGV